MNLSLTIGELLSIVVQVAVGAGIITAIRGELKSLRELFTRHEKLDEERFSDLKEDIRILSGGN